MCASLRKKQSSAQQTAAFTSSVSTTSSELDLNLLKSKFHLHLWFCFILENWILDTGRSMIMYVHWVVPFPLASPALAEFLHLLYNFSSPTILLRMLDHSPRTPTQLAVRLGVVAVVTDSSIHLVSDSVTCRLLLIGYQLHLSVRENPVMMKLRPTSLVDSFERLFYYSDTLGHVMRYGPLSLGHLLFFTGCFCHRTRKKALPSVVWMILAPNATYYWYLITEGQTFILFIFTCFAMMATVMHQRRRGLVPDADGLFMLYSFSGALLLLFVWVRCLWSNTTLRRRRCGLIYIPQPRQLQVHLRL